MTTATETGRLLRREAEPGVAPAAAPAPRKRRRPGGQLAAWALHAPLVVKLRGLYAVPH